MLKIRLFIFFFLTVGVFPLVPTNINYQGYLMLSGLPFEGQTNFSFEVLNESSASIWSENNVLLDVVGGVYSHTLRIPVSFLDPTNLYYLQVSAAGSSVTPNIPLMSVPYAYYARHVQWSNVRGKPPGFDDDIDNISSVWINQGGNIFYTNAGNVGIGTNNPAAKLTVNGPVAGTGGFVLPDGFILTGSNDLDSIGADNLGDHTALQNLILGSHYLSGDGDDEGVYVNAGGNVGIGTNNPGQRLQVHGGNVYLSTEGAGLYFHMPLAGPVYYIKGGMDSDGRRMYMGSRTSGVDLVFQTYNNPFVFRSGVTEGTNFIIDNLGRVGIGRDVPTRRLDVADGTLLVDADGAGEVNMTGHISLTRSDNPYMSIVDRSDSGMSIGASTNRVIIGWDINARDLEFRRNVSWNAFPSDGELTMIMKSNGYVGIGTSAPRSKFEVSDGINMTIHVGARVPGITSDEATVALSRYTGIFNQYNSHILTTHYETGIGYGLAFKSTVGEHSHDDWDDSGTPLTRMFISYQGHIGIGNESPQDILHIYDNVPAIRLDDSEHAGGYWQVYQNADAASDYGLTFTKDGGTTYLMLGNDLNHSAFPAGYVGIGTWTPDDLLSLVGSTSTPFGLSLKPAGWNDARHRFTVPVLGSTSILSFNWNGVLRDSALYGSSMISIENGDLMFATGTGDPVERMRINSAGTVTVPGQVTAGTVATHQGDVWIANTGSAHIFTAPAMSMYLVTVISGDTNPAFRSAAIIFSGSSALVQLIANNGFTFYSLGYDIYIQNTCGFDNTAVWTALRLR